MTQILREINFGRSGSTKSTIFDIFRGSELYDLYEFLHVSMADICMPNQKI